MSALSPYAVEFVQGEAYAGKLSNPPKTMVDMLSENLAKVKVGAPKSSRPKAGKAYDVSLKSMLIETALSRVQQPLPLSKAEPPSSKAERGPRKKKFIRPSDANKKLSKLKKSVVNYREEQAREAAAGIENVGELTEVSHTSIAIDHPSCHGVTGANTVGAEIDAEALKSTDGAGGENSEPIPVVAVNVTGGDLAPSDTDPAAEDRASSDKASNEVIREGACISSMSLVNTLGTSRKEPLKRTPTMDRLKANLQGEALKEVEQLATELIVGLKRFQDRLYNKDEIKARMRQRMYYGLKESIKFMQVQKVKMIIMARDLEAGPGGLDDLIENLLGKAKIHRVPVVIALSRNKLKRLSQKPSKVACIAITDPSGRDEQFERILELVKPLGLLDCLSEAGLQAEAEEQQRKAQQDLENWTSTTRRGRYEFAVEKLFST